jgi:hypothetical protein
VVVRGQHSFKLGMLAGALALLAGACLDNELEPSTTTGVKRVFIAQTRDFAPYKEWMVYEHDVSTEHGGLVGTTTKYVSEMPDATTHEFPIGSMLVKSVKALSADALTIHAMAKRGSGFNANGARGWEYFELQLNSKGVPYILWRGEEPPSGEQYQALLGATATDQPTTEGKCNDCHAGGKDGMLGDDIVELLDDP